MKYLAPLMVLLLQTAVAQDLPTKKREFFGHSRLYYVKISDWNKDWMTPFALGWEKTQPGSHLEIFQVDPNSGTHCPDGEATDANRIYRGDDFSIKTSGNMTKGMPKSSYKVKLEKVNPVFGMKTLNLKAMWNDVSQMREALAWKIFDQMDVPSSRHAYAKFCINGKYFGLYSIIEQVDKEFLEDQFGKNDKGNLYKGYWMPKDLGPSTFEHRKNSQGDDSGKQYYRAKKFDERTYRLSTNEESNDDPAHQTYDDLAALIRALHKHDPQSAEFKAELESVFDVKGFLRWAAVNVLVGAWDNYWATPANFYVYNSGVEGEAKKFMEKPYFRWIPWDYDHTFGTTYFSTQWQFVDLVDWEGSTKGYNGGGKKTKLPLIRRVLENPDFMRYYLDQLETVLDRFMNPQWVAGQIGKLWPLIERSAFLESDTPGGPAHTGRQYTNDQIYWNGRMGHFLDRGSQRTPGLQEYVKTRHETALKQLKELRKTYPKQ